MATFRCPKLITKLGGRSGGGKWCYHSSLCVWGETERHKETYDKITTAANRNYNLKLWVSQATSKNK